MVTITIAHITFTMAYVTVVVQSRLASFDDSLEEAALDLGARPAKVFFRITLPLIMPAILSGWLLAFTLSWDDVVVSQFVAGPGSNTLPMLIYSKVRLGVNPSVNALATIMVLIVAPRRGAVGGADEAGREDAANARCGWPNRRRLEWLPTAFGVDVGGSSIKYAPVDMATGRLLTELAGMSRRRGRRGRRATRRGDRRHWPRRRRLARRGRGAALR